MATATAAIAAGQLRDRIVIERAVGSAWTLLDAVWANVVPNVSAPAGLGPSDVAAPALGNAYEITLRYRGDLTNAAPGTLRIRTASEVIAIASVTDVDGRRRALRLLGQSYQPAVVGP